MDLVIKVPSWVDSFPTDTRHPTTDTRMEWVLALARANVQHATGGPFAAAVFERDSGKLVAAGVNLVLASGYSPLHAEIVAIMRAQQAVGDFRLGAAGRPALELVSSTAPCAMCLGAVPWSGVKGLVCGARDEDARAIGFDEGHKPAGWRAYLQGRGITVAEDVMRSEAAAILQEYKKAGGEIYNG